MMKVVKGEINKLLDAGIIYLISNSHWVSLVQCVLRKRGIVVMENEKHKLIVVRKTTRWYI